MIGVDAKRGLLRKTCVATKEGSGITGEERLRERVSEIYGALSQYNGRPADSQMERINVLQGEFEKVRIQAEDIYKNYLGKVNSELQTKGMKIELMPRDVFDKMDANSKKQDNKPPFEDLD